MTCLRRWHRLLCQLLANMTCLQRVALSLFLHSPASVVRERCAGFFSPFGQEVRPGFCACHHSLLCVSFRPTPLISTASSAHRCHLPRLRREGFLDSFVFHWCQGGADSHGVHTSSPTTVPRSPRMDPRISKQPSHGTHVGFLILCGRETGH